MTKKEMKPKPKQYNVWMRPVVHSIRKQIPGYVRQRIKHILDDLKQNPRPTKSRTLRLPDTVDASIKIEWELRRIRLENWRIVDAINDTWQEIAVLSIKKRPPYEYDDLEFLLTQL